jgi:hypothetical protein
MADLLRLLRLLRRGVLFELRLYRALLRWVARRPAVPRWGAEAFGYSREVTPLLLLWIFASAIEIPFFHLLIPWHTVRVVGLVISAWGLLWMLGFLAGLKVYPHLLSSSSLRVRSGPSVDICVPWDAVESLKVGRRDLPSSSRTLQRRETAGGLNLQVATSGQVNVHAALRSTCTVTTPRGSEEITELSFWADEPAQLVARGRELMTATSGAERPRD